jgi:hypothetical protein
MNKEDINSSSPPPILPNQPFVPQSSEVKSKSVSNFLGRILSGKKKKEGVVEKVANISQSIGQTPLTEKSKPLSKSHKGALVDLPSLDDQIFQEEKKVRQLSKSHLKGSPVDLPSWDELDFMESDQILQEKEKARHDLLFETREQQASQYGNKAANLFVLENICRELKHCAVPPFQAVSHAEVLKLLKKNYKNFDKDWQKFVALQKGNSGLTTESKKQLQKIRENIERGFEKSKFKKSHPSLGNILMVRSTGREDTEKGALAGGNKTVAGVENHPKAIAKAMGTVVASYFSEESFQQRLLAKQDITEAPFIPVLLQAMIGEKPDDHPSPDAILACGVCYTQEFGGDTPSLVMIEAAYGHNEGVVNNEVPTDTYYLYPDGPSHEVIVEKKERLVANPTQTGKDRFSRAENPRELTQRAALSPKAQKTLQEIATKIHEIYGKPMDIEWVYDPKGDVVYLVQARPVVKRVQTTPTYVDQKSMQDHLSYQGEMIVHKGGETILLTQANQVIRVKSLEGALSEYLKREQESKEARTENPTKMVIVDKMGSALSHAACVFRENGIAVICCPGFHSLPDQEKGNVTLVDTQRGNLIDFVDAHFSSMQSEEIVKTLKEKEVIKEGWIKHPIPGLESLKEISITEETLDPFLEFIKGHKLTSATVESGYSLASLQERIASQDIETSNLAIKDLVFLLARIAMKLAQSQGVGGELILKRAKQLLMNVMRVGKDMMERKDPMQRLHGARRMEALLQQDSARVLFSDSLRLILTESQTAKKLKMPEKKELRNLSQLESNVIRKLGHVPNSSADQKLRQPLSEEEAYHCLLTYQTLASLGLTAEVQEAWKAFSNDILASQSKIANQLLTSLLSNLQQMGILAEWMNDEFYRFAQLSKGDPIQLLQLLRSDFQSAKKSLQAVQALNKDVKTWEENLEVFANPEKFKETWQIFEQRIVSPLIKNSQQLCEQKVTHPLAKKMMLKSLVHAVDVFDKAIKTMRGSPHYEDVDLKARHFLMMLQPYHQLMEVWFDAIPEQTFKNWAKNVIQASGGQLDSARYRALMKSSIAKHFQEISQQVRLGRSLKEQMFPTLGFSVQAACVNSGADFARYFDNQKHSLENFFMLFHQNILAGIQCHQIFIPNQQLPSQLNAILGPLTAIDEIVSTGGISIKDKSSIKVDDNNLLTIRPQLLSQEIEHPFIKVKYNIPLKFHSAVAEVIYDTRTAQSKVSFQIMGHNLNNRMDKIAYKTFVNSLAYEYPFDEFPSYENGILSLSWQFEGKDIEKDKNSFEHLPSLIIDMAVDSLQGNWGAILIPSFKDLEKRNSSFYERLLETPGAVQFIKNSLFRSSLADILSQLINEGNFDLASRFLKALGFTTETLDTDHFIRDFSKEVVEKLISNNVDGQMDRSQPFLPHDPVWRFIFNEINPKMGENLSPLGRSILESLLERSQEVISHLPPNKEFYLRLVEAWVKYCLTEKPEEFSNLVAQFAKREMFDVLFIIQSNHRESLANTPIYQDLTKLLQQAKYVGVEASQEDFEKASQKEISFDQLTPGDRILVREYNYAKKPTGKWIYATVKEKTQTGISALVYKYYKEEYTSSYQDLKDIKLL